MNSWLTKCGGFCEHEFSCSSTSITKLHTEKKTNYSKIYTEFVCSQWKTNGLCTKSLCVHKRRRKNIEEEVTFRVYSKLTILTKHLIYKYTITSSILLIQMKHAFFLFSQLSFRLCSLDGRKSDFEWTREEKKKLFSNSAQRKSFQFGLYRFSYFN